MSDEKIWDFTNIPSYEWSELYYLTYELDTNLSSIKQTVSHNEDLIKSRRKALQEAIDKDIYLKSDEKEEIKAQYYGHYFGDSELAIDNLEEILSNSTILSVFAVFEGRMKVLCELVEGETKSKLNHKDIRSTNGDIGQFLKYLKAVFGVTTNQSDNYLDNILKYKIVRNKIAHQSNRIKSDELAKINSLKHIKIEQYGQEHKILIKSPEFLNELVNVIETYFAALAKEVDIRMKEVKAML